MDVVRISDGLGNQMFQYAFARKISMNTEHQVYLDTRFINNEDFARQGKDTHFKKKMPHREYGLSHFNIKLPEANEKVLLPWCYLQRTGKRYQMVKYLASHDMWFWQYRQEAYNFDGTVPKVGVRFPTYYQGYFFDLKYFDDIRTVLQREFSLRDKITLSYGLREIINQRNTVSIHIRRGDFLRLNRDISESGYYQRAVSIMESKILNPVYLVFSDDMAWVRENIDLRGEKIYISEMGFKDYEEMSIMKHCRNHIIANSTFSFWAAYLNQNEDKTVICPKRWRSSIIPKCWETV